MRNSWQISVLIHASTRISKTTSNARSSSGFPVNGQFWFVMNSLNLYYENEKSLLINNPLWDKQWPPFDETTLLVTARTCDDTVGNSKDLCLHRHRGIFLYLCKHYFNATSHCVNRRKEKSLIFQQQKVVKACSHKEYTVYRQTPL